MDIAAFWHVFPVVNDTTEGQSFTTGNTRHDVGFFWIGIGEALNTVNANKRIRVFGAVLSVSSAS